MRGWAALSGIRQRSRRRRVRPQPLPASPPATPALRPGLRVPPSLTGAPLLFCSRPVPGAVSGHPPSASLPRRRRALPAASALARVAPRPGQAQARSAPLPQPPPAGCGPLFAELPSLRTEEAELPDTTPLDQWSEDDIQNFEDGVERYGKNFFKVHGHMQGKYSVEMLVLFYYARWKSSAGFKCWLARRSKEDEEELQECVSCGKPESDEGEGPGIMLLCDNCPAAFHAVCCHPKPSYASTFAQTASPNS